MAVATKGVLFEYGLSLPPLALVFDFNPQQISRSRTVTIKTGNAPGSRRGYDFLVAAGNAACRAGCRDAGGELLDRHHARRHRPPERGRRDRRAVRRPAADRHAPLDGRAEDARARRAAGSVEPQPRRRPRLRAERDRLGAGLRLGPSVPPGLPDRGQPEGGAASAQPRALPGRHEPHHAGHRIVRTRSTWPRRSGRRR